MSGAETRPEGPAAAARRLHVLYVVQYFNDPSEPGGSRPHQFARAWAAAGHRVTVLTSNLNHKTLTTTNRTSSLDGVTVHRVSTYNRVRGGFGHRIVNFLSFAWMAIVRGLTISDVDVVYASSTPLTTGLAGCVIGGLKRVPFYFEVRDLWPESAVVAGALKNPLVVRAIEIFEKLFYRRATKVIALTEGIRAGVIAKGKDPDDVLFVPNGMDDWMLDATPTPVDNSPFSQDRHFVCTYIGAHGRWNKLETILEAAARVRGTRIRFLLIGDGDFKPQLQQYANELGLDNLCFLDAVPKRRILDYLAASHVGMICTWDHEFQRMVLANKVFDYMAAGCPIVAAAQGETADLVQRADCGWAVRPERPDDLAALLVSLSDMGAGPLREKGANGRAYVRKHYLRSELAAGLQQVFLRAV
jgi:glycosyltransferase involved in cell wall biosynthesis